ncbi:GH14136 [Drosophila grimshawi]|uniref:GH14136 n=2 Tax=Drosophila grimshawi TaxID=7222 RepID=B4JXX0_DROGR|nr:GH14136 [Drosophila grimshawi]
MAHYVVALSLLLVVASCSSVLSAPDEERYVSKDYNRDLYDWLTATRYAVAGQPYKYPYYLGNSVASNMRLPKRNSELINSLLSLPKNMNEAGK